jgi:glyoxylate reductase
MAKVVSSTPLFREEVERITNAGHRLVRPAEDERWGGARIHEELVDAEALLCLLTDEMDGAALRGAPKLRVVANIAVGYENIDIEAASAAGIVVTNTPDVLTEATADLAMALLLAASRRVAEADARLRRGEFPPWSLCQPLLGLDVHGKTLGIVGMGRIGTAVARRAARGFSMRILYCSRGPKPDVEAQLGAERVSFESLLQASDAISIHVPLTEATRRLFDRTALSQMKSTAILVNTARGAIVDEAALAAALQRRTIAGAGIDVFECEPTVHPGLLAARDRVVLTPHLGSATLDTRRAMARLAVDNVLAVLAGEAPLTPVG